MKLLILEGVNRLNSSYYLNKVIVNAKILAEQYPNSISLILEDVDTHHYEWDFDDNKFRDLVNNIEVDIRRSTSHISTASEALGYLKSLLTKASELPDKLKSDVIKLAIAGMALNMGAQELLSLKTTVDSQPISSPFSKYEVAIDAAIDNITLKAKDNEKKSDQKFSSNLITVLKKHEGIGGEPVLTAYNIGDGAYTIGYGHAVFKDVSRGDNSSNYDFLVPYNVYEKIKAKGSEVRITQEQAEQLLKDDVKVASDGLDRLLKEWELKGIKPKITQPMYDAMVSMTYNMGIQSLRNSDFIQLVKHNRFKEAAEAIKSTSNQMFRKYPGLISRRSDESEMFKGNYPI